MNQLIHTTSPTLVLHQLGWGIPHAIWRNHAYAFYLNSITNSNGNTKISLAWTTIEELGKVNKPECIYNVNGKGGNLCLHKQPFVLTQKGRKHVHLVAAEHGENITIMSSGNVVGSARNKTPSTEV